MKTFWGVFIQATSAASGGVLIYMALAYLLKMNEIKDIKDVFKFGK